MPALERMIGLRGAHFYRGPEGELLFVNHLDSSTRDGPRAAVKEDSLEHPEAWAKFAMGDDQAEPFAPIATFIEPPGGEPLKEVGPHASKRAAARARGEVE